MWQSIIHIAFLRSALAIALQAWAAAGEKRRGLCRAFVCQRYACLIYG